MAEPEASGAERAFARVHRERYASLVGLARLLLDDASRADRIVEEAFARALVRSSGEPDDAYGLVRRQIVGLTRNRMKSGRRSRDAGHDREIAAALGSLKHLDLEALVVRHYEGLGPDVGASVLGIDPTAFDERLRGAMSSMPAHLEPNEVPAVLRAEARTTEVQHPSWANVLDEARRVRGRQRLVAVVAVLALGAAIAIAGLTSDWFGLTGVGHTDHASLPLATSDPPAHMLVVTEDGAMQIISTSDGDVVRTVRRGLEPSRAPVAVSPDGRYAYIDQPVEDARCDNDLEIVRIDLATGRSERIADGRSPALSHDGKQWAFVQAPERCGVYDMLGIGPVGETPRMFLGNEPGTTITYVRWSFDDTRIGYTILDETGYRNVERRVPIRDEEPTELDLRTGDEPVGYLSENRLVVMYSEGDKVELFIGPQLIAQRRDVSIDLIAVAVDKRGEHLLWREAPRSGRGRLAPGKVVRLAIGDRPVVVTGDAVQATWLERLVEAR